MATKILTIESIKQCTSCPLHCVRRQVVTGRGSLPCDVLGIGEAPGRSEDLLSEAFIGEAGKLLDRMFIVSGLASRNIFLTNTVLCHPTNKKGGANREPRQEEVIACMGNVAAIANWAQAREVLLIGDVPKTYFKKTFPQAVYISHPSFLLRTGGDQSPHYLKNIRILEDLNARM